MRLSFLLGRSAPAARERRPCTQRPEGGETSPGRRGRRPSTTNDDAQQTADIHPPARSRAHGGARARGRPGRFGGERPEPGDREHARLDHRPARRAGNAAVDDRRRPLPARGRRPGDAREGEGLDPGGADRVRARAAGAGAGHDCAADRRRLTRRGLILAAALAVALVAAPAALAVALVAAPAALAIRFTDDSYLVPTGVVGQPYAHQLRGNGGCGPAFPYQFRVLSGSLPPGLSLSQDGLVSGTPTQAGSWSFWLELSDQDPPSAAWCRPAKSQREFTIAVAPRDTGAQQAQPPAATLPQPPPSQPPAGSLSQPPGGIQVGPPLPADQGGSQAGGQVNVDKDK